MLNAFLKNHKKFKKTRSKGCKVKHSSSVWVGTLAVFNCLTGLYTDFFSPTRSFQNSVCRMAGASLASVYCFMSIEYIHKKQRN